MGIEQSLEKKEAIVKEFGWDLTGDSPDNPRSKFFFEADAEKIMIFLEKDKLVIQQLEASLKESQDKVAQWITDYDELESENHRIQSRLQEAERDKLTEFAISEERQKKIERLEAELSRHKAALKESKSQAEAIKEANSTGVKNGLAGGIIKIVDDTLASEPLTLPSGDEKER